MDTDPKKTDREVSMDMVHRTMPTCLITGIRLRCLYMFVGLMALLFFLFTLTRAYNLSAVEIPVSLLAGPHLAASAGGTVTEDLLAETTLTEISPESWIEKQPIILSPPADAYLAYSITIDHVSDYSIVSLPEVRQKIEIDTGVTTDQKENPEDPFIPIILEAASRHGVDPAIIKAIIMAESNYNPRAVSHRGAMGLMQLMPTTAKALGVNDIFNPEQNINAGVRYFKQLLIRFNGDVRLALAAYNAGSRKVRKYKGIPPFKTTRRYIRKVLKYRKIYDEELNG